MKKTIHPEYYSDVTVSCACGNSFITGSTVTAIKTEICSNCHPFYTGKQKLIDTAGTVDKFKKRVQIAAETKAKAVAKKPRKARESK